MEHKKNRRHQVKCLLKSDLALTSKSLQFNQFAKNKHGAYLPIDRDALDLKQNVFVVIVIMKVKAPLQNLPKNPALTATNQSLGLTDTIISVLH